MSMTQKQLENLQKVGRLSKLLEKKKERDIQEMKFASKEFSHINAGRADPLPKNLKPQIDKLAELAQIIKQAREKQFELSQAKVLSELKQTEFFEKQAKPVVKALEENAPDDNVEELKELKNRLLKIGMPLASILSIEANLKSVVESVSKSDSEDNRYEMVSQYNALFLLHPLVSGFEEKFQGVLNDYYDITARVKYENVKNEMESGIPTLSVRLNEDDTRDLINDSDTGLNPEQIQKLISYLLSKGIIDQKKPVITPPPPPVVAPAPAPVIFDDGEIKAEPPVEPIMPSPVGSADYEGYKEILLDKPPDFYIGGIESKKGLKTRVDKELVKIVPKQYRKQLSKFIIEEYVPSSSKWKELPDVPPPPKSSIESAPKRGRPKKSGIEGRGLTMEDLRTKTNLGIRKKLGLVPPSTEGRPLGSPVLVGKGLNISNMTPAQLMNNLALNIASQRAGNTGVGDVINSIIDEMHRKNIISKAEHKKLWYAYCD